MNPTILLVEDDENDVFFLKHAMKKNGMLNPLQVASDGREAIHYLEGGGEFGDRVRFPVPSLVLLDLKLPHVMGLEVLKWIREQPKLRCMIVLIFSSSKMPQDISSAYELGANSYLVKPSDPQGLTRIIGFIHQYWFMLNVIPPSAAEATTSPMEIPHGVFHQAEQLRTAELG